MISKNKEKVGILGYGEVGQAIAKFYKNPRLRQHFDGQAKIKDLNKDNNLTGVDILHICIPFTKDFLKIAKREIKRIKPKLTIIHSTVAPGTTKKLIFSLPKNLKMIVHSPIRGDHPYLYKGIKTFIKYIGAENKKAAKLAENHFESLGIKTRTFCPSTITEIGKLFDTSYYGLCIAWHGEMEKFCKKFKVDFKKAVTDFNQTYKEGYLKLKRDNVIRPTLHPPKGYIAGHCIIPNAEILRKYFKSEGIDLILKYKPKK